MKVMVTGGRGFVGNFLTGMLVARGDKVTVVSRRPGAVRTARAGVTIAAWLPELAGFDAVVNLAGEPIFGRRWSPEQKENIRTSRISGTGKLARSLAELPAGKRPRVLVSASAIGYYGDRGDELLSESSPPGRDFLAEVCRAWEDETGPASAAGVRTVCPRIGVVLGLDGGALQKMLPPFRLGIGGPIGLGRQWMSWIHERDLSRLILHAIDREELSGAVNAVAPAPVTNRDFSRTLGRVLRRPAILPVPPLALRVLYGEAASILTASQRCSADKALATGFRFEFEGAEAALRQLLHR
jgi:uncharacterized protein (TIGR01777 family)